MSRDLPPDWESQYREPVLQRDGYRCRTCGAGDDASRLTVVHVVPPAEGGEHRPENLETRCPDCRDADGGGGTASDPGADSESGIPRRAWEAARDARSDDEGSSGEAWYENHTGPVRRPWVSAVEDADAPSAFEYLRQQHEEGMSRRDLLLVGAGTVMLVFFPAALVAGILTFALFPFVESYVLWWAGLTLAAMAALVVAIEYA